MQQSNSAKNISCGLKSSWNSPATPTTEIPHQYQKSKRATLYVTADYEKNIVYQKYVLEIKKEENQYLRILTQVK